MGCLKPLKPATILTQMTDIPNPRRRWLRYSLTTLLVLVVLASIGMGWAAHRLERTARQKEAVEAILATGATLRFDFEIDQSGNSLPEASLPGPAWLRYWIGDDLGGNVVEAEVRSDDALQHTKDLPQLRQLHLVSKGITDTGLGHLEQMSQLEMLQVSETGVTERGIKTLRKALPNCRIVR